MMICKAGVDVPATESEAQTTSGWTRAGSGGIRPLDAPDWSLHGRCEGDEVCAVYKNGTTGVTARYCNQNQCSNYWTGPYKACGSAER